MINIQIDDNNMAIVEIGRKTRRIKTVSALSLVSALNGMTGLSTPLLFPGIRQYIQRDKFVIVALEIPSMSRRFNFVNRENKTIVAGPGLFPWELFLFKFEIIPEGLKLYEQRLYAMKHSLQAESDELYHMPLSNVYDSSGNVCWGTTFHGNGESLRRIETIAQVGRFVSLFHDSNFNTDLSPRFVEDGTMRMEDLFREMKEMTAYNERYLIPFDRTYAQAMEAFLS
jgi:hypothetical protein